MKFAPDPTMRNEPLLPRSASFGSRSTLQKLASKAGSVVHAVCQGEEAGVKMACVSACIGGLTIGLLGVLNPLAVISPLHLLTCLYLLGFSLVALSLEVEVQILEPFRLWVSFWLRGLTQMTGRGALYLVLGSLAAGLGDPLALLAGLVLMGAGAACLWYVSRYSSQAAADDDVLGEMTEGVGVSRDDARLHGPRMAFRRRVLFGMERMDSAELVALCLELGLPLDARSRMAALSRLDPHQVGSIDEESFMLWWEQQQGRPMI